MATKSQPKTVAIVGAGVSGLVSIKECLAEGFAVQCFERSSALGGVWTYGPENQTAMYEGCMLNSCRDTTAFSDFPLDPARYGDYFSHHLMSRYLHEYADHFGLKEHVRFRTSVLQCRPRDGGGWTVKIQEEGKEPQDLGFDALFCCSGALRTPMIPDFKGRDAFKGQLLHSHEYRTPGPFEGKKVALVGLGSTAVDVACEVAPFAKEFHLVSQRGAWVLPRYLLGKPIEAWDNRATQVWLPASIGHYLQTVLLTTVCGQPPKPVRPDHGIVQQNPTIRTDFYEKVQTGVVTVHRAAVDNLTEAGLALSTGENLDVDVIILATGYTPELPYLPADALRDPSTPPPHYDLYRLLMAPRYEDLFVLGFVELFGAYPPVAEAQARHAAAVVSGRVARPSREAMERAIAADRAWLAAHLLPSARHVLTRFPLEYAGELLAPLGAGVSARRLLARMFTSNPLRAWKVFGATYFGVCAGAQWRLFGHGAKPELAAETLLRMAAGGEELSKAEKALL